MLATSTLPSCRILTTSRGTPSPATNSDAPPLTTLCASSSMRSGSAASRSTPNGLSVSGAHAAHLVVELLRRHRRRAERAEAAGVGHRGDDRVVGDAAHSGEHDGVFDAEHLGQSCVHTAHRCSRTVSRDHMSVPASPLVGVIMGSDSDLPVMQGAIDVLVEFGVRARGAHRLRPPHARRDGRVRPRRPPAAGCG